MKLFSKKSTFLIGSILGSVVGLLFASESGKTLRGKLKSAKSPQKKFEALFEEYLRVGKSAIAEAQKSEAMKELVKGGKEILAELKKKAESEGGSAVKFAHKKAAEVLKEVEKQADGAKKKVRRKVATAKKQVLKKTAKLVPAKAKKLISKTKKLVSAKARSHKKKKPAGRKISRKK